MCPSPGTAFYLRLESLQRGRPMISSVIFSSHQTNIIVHSGYYSTVIIMV
jgi:hypothetical protein